MNRVSTGPSFNEKPTICHTQGEHRFVVVLLLQETLGVFCLDDDLRDGIIVHPDGHYMAVSPLVIGFAIGFVLMMVLDDGIRCGDKMIKMKKLFFFAVAVLLIVTGCNNQNN